jgi:hypothetical protein
MSDVMLVGIAFAAALAGGCAQSTPTTPQSGGGPDMRTVQLHIDGFRKSKSGAI